MSTEENVKKLLEYCYNNIRGGFNEPPYTASYVAYDGHMKCHRSSWFLS